MLGHQLSAQQAERQDPRRCPLPGVACDDGRINCTICTPGGTVLLGLPSCAATPGCVVQGRQAVRSMCPGCMRAELRGGRGTGRTVQGCRRADRCVHLLSLHSLSSTAPLRGIGPLQSASLHLHTKLGPAARCLGPSPCFASARSATCGGRWCRAACCCSRRQRKGPSRPACPPSWALAAA